MVSNVIKCVMFMSAVSHEDVEKIVAAACKYNVCLVPFGGEHSLPLRTCMLLFVPRLTKTCVFNL